MKQYLSRRGVLGSLLAGSAAACSPAPKVESFSAARPMATGTFSHGIASGDPLANSVILWTRISPDNPNDGPMLVAWEMSLDSEFSNITASGTFETGPARNWTVKVDAEGLSPGTDYFYRFSTGDALSPTGQTRTLPDGPTQNARFAVVSCANWQHGYFNAYDHIARQADAEKFDALLHLGDYIYEYAAEHFLETEMGQKGRLHEPRHEIITLDDYRVRHAQYRTDPSLQAVTARMPMISIWDDHESSNDSWKTGAENHQDGEGEWEARKQAAMRAYYEWMPVRDPAPGKTRESLYRSFEWGDLLTLTAVETRLLARGEPIIIDHYFDMIREAGGADRFKADILNDPNRDMLGQEQLSFITDTFKQSKADGKPWRLLANQVVMGRLATPDLTPHVDEAAMVAIEPQWGGIRDFVELSTYSLPVYPDSWDGYPAAREKLYSALHGADIHDMLVVTGDAHEFWVNDLTNNDGVQMGVEIGTTSVSSETLAAFLGEATADYALLMTQSNPDVRYYNALHNGYTDLRFTPKKATAHLIAIDTVTETDYGAFEAARFTVKPAKETLKITDAKGLNMKQKALFAGLG